MEWPKCRQKPIMNALRNAKDAIDDGDLTSLIEIIVTLPSHAITFAEFDDLFTPMLKDGYSGSMLSLASSRGYLNMVRYLLTAGSDPDAVDDEGWTALHYACSEGQLAVAEELVLWARARVNIPDRDGETALVKAVKEKHVMIVLLLLEHGGDSKGLSNSR